MCLSLISAVNPTDSWSPRPMGVVRLSFSVTLSYFRVWRRDRGFLLSNTIRNYKFSDHSQSLKSDVSDRIIIDSSHAK